MGQIKRQLVSITVEKQYSNVLDRSQQRRQFTFFAADEQNNVFEENNVGDTRFLQLMDETMSSSEIYKAAPVLCSR